MDTKTATLATIPGREDELALCLASLLPQFDWVNVVFNYGDTPLPQWVIDMAKHHSPLRLSLADNTWGDAAKFAFSVDRIPGYQFFCDDDLVYPPDYAAQLVAKIETYHRRAAVSMAGSVIHGRIASYYNQRVTFGHCLHPLIRDVAVNVLGTGVLAFHTDLLHVPLDNATFPSSNMADVHFAVLCQQLMVPMVCVAHAPLHYPPSMRGKWTIWDEANAHVEHDRAQAERCNEVQDWRVHHVS